MIFTKKAFGSILEISTDIEILSDDIEKINKIVDNFENKYSRFIKNNFLYRLNQKGSYLVDTEFKALFSFCYMLNKLTKGYFDITVISTLEELGYGRNFKTKNSKVGFSNITLTGDKLKLNGTAIEFGSIGKGYIIDKLYDLLIARYKNIIINFGGDIRVGNIEKTIGLEDPCRESSIIGDIKIKNMSFASSSGQKRSFLNSHHLINPKNKNSQNDKLSIYVTHKYSIFADGFSTALFVTPLEKSLKILEKIDGLEGLIISSSGEIYKTSGFNINLF